MNTNNQIDVKSKALTGQRVIKVTQNGEDMFLPVGLSSENPNGGSGGVKFYECLSTSSGGNAITIIEGVIRDDMYNNKSLVGEYQEVSTEVFYCSATTQVDFEGETYQSMDLCIHRQHTEDESLVGKWVISRYYNGDFQYAAPLLYTTSGDVLSNDATWSLYNASSIQQPIEMQFISGGSTWSGYEMTWQDDWVKAEEPTTGLQIAGFTPEEGKVYTGDTTALCYLHPDEPTADVIATTASATDIKGGLTAVLNGTLTTGTMPTSTATPSGNVVTITEGYKTAETITVGTAKEAETYTPGTNNQIISADTYLKGEQIILGDSNLLAENIKEGVTIFGVVGTYAVSSSSSTESDIVSLLNLPRAISEYTDEHIGEIISIPYTDESGNIAGPIEFEVVGVNHHKDINDESKPTITLMTKNIIRCAAFDAKEPNNPNSERADYGNGRWSVSNIRQWLNSEGAANEWFTAQHEYDTAPDTTNVKICAYLDDPGFLAGFSDDVKQHFATVANITLLPSVDGSGTETTQDKVFLPSYTEMNFGNLDDNNPEGTALSGKFTDNSSRVKTALNNYYWMRSPDFSFSSNVYSIYDDGSNFVGSACDGIFGITPLLVLC